MERIKKVDKPNKTVNFEVYSDNELTEILKADKLPKKLVSELKEFLEDGKGR